MFVNEPNKECKLYVQIVVVRQHHFVPPWARLMPECLRAHVHPAWRVHKERS